MAYLLHSSILVAFFVVFYWLLLKKETFYKLNRWLILGSVILSLVLPLVSVPAFMSFRTSDTVGKSETIFAPIIEANEVVAASTPIVESAQPENTIPPTDAEATTKTNFLSSLTLGQIIWYVYLLGAIIFSLVFLMQLIVLLSRRYTLKSFKAGKYRMVELVKEQEPYSFLNAIFINPESYDPQTYEHIVEHEKVHVDQVHFFDKLLAEVLIIIFWFNPFVWWLRNLLSENLEYLTDKSLVNKGLSKEDYQMSLLKVSTAKQPFNLTTSYNNNFLKSRILMMNSKNSSLTSSWKYFFLLPVFLLSIMSLNAVQPNSNNLLTENTEESLLQEEKPKKSQEETQTENSTKNLELNPTQQKPIVNSSVDDLTKVTLKLNLPEIDQLMVSHNIYLNIRQGNQQSIEVKGPQGLIKMLNRDVKDGAWKVKYKKKNTIRKALENEKLEIYMTMKSLKLLDTSGACKVEGVGKFYNKNKIQLHGSGASDLYIDVETPKLICMISGATEMEVSGTAKTLKAHISGAGHIQAPHLVTETSDMQISGAGDIIVTVTKELSAVISGSGTIQYKGNPTISDKVITGSGAVVPYN